MNDLSLKLREKIVVRRFVRLNLGEGLEKREDNLVEEVAKMAAVALTINPDAAVVDQYLLDKHYRRKHGKNAYYGQR